jgi:DNA-binding NarL/FixJ family response regulator
MPLQILIADDERSIRRFIRDYLELQGYAVITADNGEQALSLVEKYHPHLLISDIKMPKKDGYDLVKELRKKPQFRLLPVIFLTQRSSTAERIRGYQVGCDVYLSKPFQIEELGAVVRYLLERSQIVQSELWFSEQEHQGQLSKLEPSYPLNLLHLTSREKEVLDLLSQGLSNLKIGENLHLSPKTVEKYVSSLLKKTATNNRTELVRFALDHNLLE